MRPPDSCPGPAAPRPHAVIRSRTPATTRSIPAAAPRIPAPGQKRCGATRAEWPGVVPTAHRTAKHPGPQQKPRTAAMTAPAPTASTAPVPAHRPSPPMPAPSSSRGAKYPATTPRPAPRHRPAQTVTTDNYCPTDQRWSATAARPSPLRKHHNAPPQAPAPAAPPRQRSARRPPPEARKKPDCHAITTAAWPVQSRP